MPNHTDIHHRFSRPLTSPVYVVSFRQTLNDEIYVRESPVHVYLQLFRWSARIHSPKRNRCWVRSYCIQHFHSFLLKSSSGYVYMLTSPRARRPISPTSQSTGDPLMLPQTLLPPQCACISSAFSRWSLAPLHSERNEDSFCISP